MMNERADTEQSYLASDIGEDAIASFFHAAADLFRAKPWEIVPDDESLFSVTIDSLDMREAVMSVIGQMGQGIAAHQGDDLARPDQEPHAGEHRHLPVAGAQGADLQ